MAEGRKTWMDAVRGTCIFLVLLLHATVAVDHFAVRAPDWLMAFNRLFGPYRMPTLIFLSGMLLGRSLRKPLLPYAEGKLAQIYWPFLVWSIVILLAESRFTLEFILKTPISAPTMLWYLWFLTAYYFIMFVLDRLKIPLIPVVIASLLASTVLPDFLRMDRFAFLFAFFLIGHIVASRQYALLGNCWLGMAGLLAAVAGALINASGTIIQYQATYAWAPLGMLLFITWFGQFYRSSAAFAYGEWVGRNSLVFYVIHFPVQVVVTRGLRSFGVQEFWAIFPAAFFGSLIAGVVLQLLRERFALVAGLFDFGALARFVRRLRTATATAGAG
ncbi:MAG: acyltransferase [Sphingopyxis sp.]|nr:acyltransferase [Sphingopyxis sp.]